MNLPRFNLGDKVQFTVTGKLEGVDATVPHQGYIRCIRVVEGSEDTDVVYDIMPDYPRPYTTFTNGWTRREDRLTLVDPSPFKAAATPLASVVLP